MNNQWVHQVGANNQPRHVPTIIQPDTRGDCIRELSYDFHIQHFLVYDLSKHGFTALRKGPGTARNGPEATRNNRNRPERPRSDGKYFTPPQNGSRAVQEDLTTAQDGPKTLSRGACELTCWKAGRGSLPNALRGLPPRGLRPCRAHHAERRLALRQEGILVVVVAEDVDGDDDGNNDGDLDEEDDPTSSCVTGQS